MSDEKTKKLCANCKHKMLGWRCLKDEHLDCVKGAKNFGTCEEHRDFSYCKDYEDKEVGRSKTEDQLTIINGISYIATMVSASLVIMGLFAFLIVAVIYGQ